MRRLSSSQKTSHARRGVAAVELAVASPVLVLLLLGTLDLGQFVNMGEVMSNTSRISARKAARSFSDHTDEVKLAAVDHLDHHFAHVSRTRLENATTVTITDVNGGTITGAQLKDVKNGNQLNVTVTFDYSQIRWVGGGLPFLDNSNLSFTTSIRRI